jgi:hypothetical protein
MTTHTTTSPQGIMYRLVQQAESDFLNDRRAYQRFPFFRLVALKDDARVRTAFVRDISESGMGLLHDFELHRDERMEILVGSERRTLQACVRNCEPVGDGWWISACRIDLDCVGNGD